MNQKAKALGLKNTYFKNSTGLDIEGHYSSAKDMSIIAKELIKHKKILEYSSKYESYLREKSNKKFWLVNTNKLIKSYEGMDGLKTGYTDSKNTSLEEIMLRRKIEQSLARWKDLPDRKPLLIKGCRQCGKTFSVLDFAHKHYEHVIYLNFFQNPDYNSVFSGSLETDNLIMMISALLGPDAVFKPGKTVIVLDEIQECPEARTALKFFKLDGRFDVIGTGSLLGVRGYGKDPRSIPVGYETVIDMYPLDFEEFLWANGITEAMISLLRRCLAEEKPVPEALHNRFRQLLLQYTVVGGMPAVVQAFIDTHQLGNVLQLQRDIIRSYEDAKRIRNFSIPL